MHERTDGGCREHRPDSTYPHALDAIWAASCRAVPVALPSTGDWDLPGITAALRQTAPRLAYVIADFHNPTGRLLAEEQRAQLVRAARRARTMLVVDETLVDLGLDGPPPPPVAVHGREVLTIGSMSKSFWGGLRIGWVRGPAELIARLTAVRTTLDLGSPIVELVCRGCIHSEPPDTSSPNARAWSSDDAGAHPGQTRARPTGCLPTLLRRRETWWTPRPRSGCRRRPRPCCRWSTR